MFRADVNACGGRIEANLAALDRDAAPSSRLAAVAADARVIAGAARILNLARAARLAGAIEDTSGAAARGEIGVNGPAAQALLAAAALLPRLAGAADPTDWSTAHAGAIDAALSAIATALGLPIAPAAAATGDADRPSSATMAPSAARAPGGDARPRATTVLLVDDQPVIAEAIRLMLAPDPGIPLHHCVDPTRALAMAAEVRPTVILQDLVMPAVDGMTLVRYFRAYPPTRDVPILVLSTRDEPAIKAEAFRSGANDYVVKLPDRLELIARIRYLSDGFMHLLDSREAWAAVTASHQQLEIRNRFIRQIFGRYLSDEIVESLLESPGGLQLGGELRVITILMADLRGFTPLCETIEPSQVVTILNNYLGAMTDVIARHGGTINEFIGDGILAMFGAPVRRDDDARRAVACAVEMQQAMRAVNARSAALGLPAVEMGIGLNTGEAVVGNIGSDRRAKYGVVGRHVNLASRIESHTVGGQILAAASTIEQAGAGVRIDGETEIVPKGFAASMRIYDVGGIAAPYNIFVPARNS
ncbi:MAG TPA: adenylate/guanylate cyclase domain-containing protein [Polyangia bacterium]|nr:adenylate/guanylate cyclase domain-containing protein [Polyangia bacterium]